MALNPVEHRLAYICGDWLAFRDDPRWRLLVWQVPDNARRIVAAFFESQKHETDYTSGDLFILFDQPFLHAIQYSRVGGDKPVIPGVAFIR